MEYFLSFDGDCKIYFGTNLAAATDAFWEAVEKNEWCPTVEDAEGVVLVSWDNSSYDGSDYGVIIGPQVDRDWEREYGGIDRIAEEYEYKFGEWRL